MQTSELDNDLQSHFKVYLVALPELSAISNELIDLFAM